MDDFDITPEEEAQILYGMQEIDAGFYYTMLVDEDGKFTKNMQCNKCKRIGELGEPFPHRYDCPMRK